MHGENGKAVFLTGNSNPVLAEDICAILDEELMRPATKFSDGETRVTVDKSIRGKDAFVIQPTCHPVNDSLMELLVILDALKGASAGRITAVVPYYGYARQDKKKKAGEPRTASMVARMIELAGANRMLFMDLHSEQIQEFFSIPVDHLFASPVILEYVRNIFSLGEEYAIVSPDAGGTERAEYFAKKLDLSMAIIDKRREKANEIEKMQVIGNVKNKKVILVDDMLDTFGTMSKAIKLLFDEGVSEVDVIAVHAVLSGKALELIEESSIKSIVVTDTIPLSNQAKACGKIKVVSVASLLAEAMRRINNNESISSMFT